MAEDEFATITIDGMKLSKHTPANPAPLGFIAVGMTIVFYGFFAAGFYGLNSLDIYFRISLWRYNPINCKRNGI